MEKVNRRAARFVTGNHLREHGNTIKNMETLGWSPLIDRRTRLKMSMLYKIINNLIFVHPTDLVPNPRKPGTFRVPSSSVNSHLGSFFPSTIRLWNSVPHELRSKPSLDGFKDSLTNFTLPALSRN